MSGPHVTRLTLEYDGREFAGWATQPGRRTVQEELERALAVVLRRGPTSGSFLTVAGRTDAGVHALAQVASYEGALVPAHKLNTLLPHDVAVIDARSAPPGFSARHDATSRAYRYRVLARRMRGPHERGRALWHSRPLDADALDACAAALHGIHDFTAFTPTDTIHTRFRREVRTARWRREGDVLAFEIEADSFMRNMNRVLVATMLEVGAGRRTLRDFVALLDGAPRERAGATAPAHGLYLVGIGYDGRPVLEPSIR
ncbi:tRNA pseudouridine(38-40) synthase TruA [Conexibacter sp. CPCC 206217]|uniref:tRNA pseudouridine(38-40) synthase TruA n=1 Tax=Conexibacter sp. CPCC 206217 TaxID=3064574 RepID=UPI0027174316|nr:tRNA pseudouridine(38-40) synthase TruA [Conexibacter sp. CPCC 206217]MDO8209691.1 tRNA pseudouridine(38-40) synthase TruA [Conexibacter sp. CPCC 206217]